MSYLKWFDEHARRHRAIMEKLTHLSDREVIEYFRFENMQRLEPGFCPLYPLNQKCHDLDTLNCYLCACPHFRFNDRGIAQEGENTLYSRCAIDSPEGKRYLFEGAIHQDCSNCTIPHDEVYIARHFDRDWKRVMKRVCPVLR